MVFEIEYKATDPSPTSCMNGLYSLDLGYLTANFCCSVIFSDKYTAWKSSRADSKKVALDTHISDPGTAAITLLWQCFRQNMNLNKEVLSWDHEGIQADSIMLIWCQLNKEKEKVCGLVFVCVYVWSIFCAVSEAEIHLCDWISKLLHATCPTNRWSCDVFLLIRISKLQEWSNFREIKLLQM